MGQGQRGNRGPRPQGRFRNNRQGRFDDERHPPRRRHIRHEGRKGDRKGKVEDRNLDRQLQNYWIKKKGGEGQADGKDLARERMNAEMEAYWNKKEEKPEQNKQK